MINKETMRIMNDLQDAPPPSARTVPPKHLEYPPRASRDTLKGLKSCPTGGDRSHRRGRTTDFPYSDRAFCLVPLLFLSFWR